MTFTLFVKPVLKLLTGQKPTSTIIQAKIAEDIYLDPRPEYHRCVLGKFSIFVKKSQIKIKQTKNFRLFRAKRGTRRHIYWLAVLRQHQLLLEGEWADYCSSERRKTRQNWKGRPFECYALWGSLDFILILHPCLPLLDMVTLSSAHHYWICWENRPQVLTKVTISTPVIYSF